MKSKTLADNSTQSVILVTLPTDVLEDLGKFASFNETQLDDLVFSYIVDGIANDSRILKRMEFTDKANRAFGNKPIHSKTAEAIVNDFNLVY